MRLIVNKERRAAPDFAYAKTMLLVIDNYDSFTYNLVQYLGELGAAMKIFRNDEITADEIENELKTGKDPYFSRTRNARIMPG